MGGLCAGQGGGIEVAVNSMVDLFQDDQSQGLLQIDAENAFNLITLEVIYK